jgi:hypothetical protein
MRTRSAGGKDSLLCATRAHTIKEWGLARHDAVPVPILLDAILFSLPPTRQFPGLTTCFDRRESMDTRNINVRLYWFFLAPRPSALAPRESTRRRSSLRLVGGCRHISCRNFLVRAVPRSDCAIRACGWQDR